MVFLDGLGNKITVLYDLFRVTRHLKGLTDENGYIAVEKPLCDHEILDTSGGRYFMCNQTEGYIDIFLPRCRECVQHVTYRRNDVARKAGEALGIGISQKR